MCLITRISGKLHEKIIPITQTAYKSNITEEIAVLLKNVTETRIYPKEIKLDCDGRTRVRPGRVGCTRMRRQA